MKSTGIRKRWGFVTHHIIILRLEGHEVRPQEVGAPGLRVLPDDGGVGGATQGEQTQAAIIPVDHSDEDDEDDKINLIIN